MIAAPGSPLNRRVSDGNGGRLGGPSQVVRRHFGTTVVPASRSWSDFAGDASASTG